MGPVKSMTARDWTVADAYASLPESGTRRHEVIDGELVVSPETFDHHQFRVFELARILHAARTPGLRVSGGPVNLDIGSGRHLEPDLVVKHTADINRADAIPVLVVEVLSPSTPRLPRARWVARAGLTAAPEHRPGASGSASTARLSGGRW